MTPADDDDADAPDARAFLERFGFDAKRSVLTRRQAEILVLRDRGYSQAAIADRLGTSRANVANIEASGRENVQKARETVRFVEAMKAPVRVPIHPGTDIYDVPDEVFDACNEADIKVAHTAPDLMKRLLDEAAEAIRDRTVETPLTVSVNADGEILIRQGNSTVG